MASLPRPPRLLRTPKTPPHPAVPPPSPPGHRRPRQGRGPPVRRAPPSDLGSRGRGALRASRARRPLPAPAPPEVAPDRPRNPDRRYAGSPTRLGLRAWPDRPNRSRRDPRLRARSVAVPPTQRTPAGASPREPSPAPSQLLGHAGRPRCRRRPRRYPHPPTRPPHRGPRHYPPPPTPLPPQSPVADPPTRRCGGRNSRLGPRPTGAPPPAQSPGSAFAGVLPTRRRGAPPRRQWPPPSALGGARVRRAG